MQNFVNFNFGQILGQAKDLGREGLATAKGLSQIRSTQIGAGIGSISGLVAGSSAAESNEDRLKTTKLGRAGKLLYGATIGGVAGGGVGTGIHIKKLADTYAGK